MNDRAWRVILVILACLGIWGGRRHLLVWMAGGAVVYQAAIHTLVLYNPRYSISALDLLLVLLAAQGVAFLWRQQHGRLLVGAGAVATITAGIAIGAHHQRSSMPLMPDLAVAPNARLLQKAEASAISTQGWDRDPFTAEASMTAEKATLEWTAEPLSMDHFSILRLAMPRFEGKCQRVWIRHSRPDGISRSTLLHVRGLRQGQDITWGTAPLLLPSPPGKLSIDFECEPGTRMQLGELGLYDASQGRLYRQKAIAPTP